MDLKSLSVAIIVYYMIGPDALSFSGTFHAFADALTGVGESRLGHMDTRWPLSLCSFDPSISTEHLMQISQAQIYAYHRDGAVMIPNLFSDWVETIQAGIDRNMRDPGPYAAENLKDGEGGRFFDDYCNWHRIPEFADVIEKSGARTAAAALMGSERVQVFHDHVLVKEPGTSKPTPWHQDSPYYFIDGEQTLSFWIPVDTVTEASLRLIAGSHRWPKPVLPTKWLNEDSFYPNEDDYIAVPDPDAEPSKFRVLEWPMQPGDAVAFHFKTLHGARGNLSEKRRRAFSLRLIGDDARYVTRPGKTSPPFPDHGMSDGDRLREDWFPTLS